MHKGAVPAISLAILCLGCGGGSQPDAAVPDAVAYDANPNPCFRVPAGTPCGDPTDTDCDRADTCLNGFCLPHIELAGTPCGDHSQDECDQPDTCDGSGTCLPNHVAEGTACGNEADTDCSDPDTCDGTGLCASHDAADGLACNDCAAGAGQCNVCVSGDCWDACTRSEVATIYQSDNDRAGVMFDVRALNTLQIKSFDANIFAAEPLDVEIYYRPGTYIGYESDMGAWILLGRARNIRGGADVPSPIPIVIDVTVPAGEFYGFYLTTTAATGLLQTTGTAEGQPYATDANLEYFQGIGMDYPFGQAYRPVIFNGTIHYEEPPCQP